MTDLFEKVIWGAPHRNDALWKITKGDLEEAITEYNREITGYSEGLKDIIKYGANAYYWVIPPGELQRQGWTVEAMPRRGSLKTVTKYYAADGTEFTDALAAMRHEFITELQKEFGWELHICEDIQKNAGRLQHLIAEYLKQFEDGSNFS